MDRRVFVFFCLLTAVTSENPKFEIAVKGNMMECVLGSFPHNQSQIELNYDNSGSHTCKKTCPENEVCPTEEILVKVVGSENLIELNLKDVAAVLISDILVTVLIGWAVYSICAQPMTRVSYQGNKASDRQALINNHAPGGDTYQRLNTRQDEYSTLHAQRKPKNKQSV